MADLADEDLIETIVDGIKEDGRIKPEYIRVEVSGGKPHLSGRVASDEELEILDEIMTDVLDIGEYDNTVWVDDELAFEMEEGDERRSRNDDDDDDVNSTFEESEDEDDDE